MNEIFSKLSFVSLCGAAVMFFLPWTDIKCNGRSLATQSGLQTVTADVSLSEEFSKQPGVQKNNKSELDKAYLLGVALLLIAGGVIAAGAAAFGGSVKPSVAGILAGAALVIILLQAAIGFPINNEIEKERGKMTNAQTKMQDSPFNLDSSLKAMIDIRAERTAWFYIELLALGLPAVLCWITPAGTKKKDYAPRETP